MARTTGPLTVAIIDDHPVVIEGIQTWLSEEPRISVGYTGETSDVEPGVADVLILDLNLHGRLVIGDIATLAAAGQRVIAFSQFTEQRVVLESLEAGCMRVRREERGAGAPGEHGVGGGGRQAVRHADGCGRPRR